MSFSANFIGCGRLGRTLAKLFKNNNAIYIESILNTRIENARDAVSFIGAGVAVQNIAELSLADLNFITTRDDMIEETCRQLGESRLLKAGSTVIHCSGSLTSDILSAARKQNCLIASIHLIKSFADPKECVKNFSGTYCAIEGDPEAVIQLKALFEKIGAKVFQIKKENKILYHAAGVMANNYVVTLHYQAVECYKLAGIDEDTANKIASMLMNDASINLKKMPHSNALTGPLQRGDAGTIQKHVAALEDNQLLHGIYTRLGLGTLPITTHSMDIKKALEEILKN